MVGFLEVAMVKKDTRGPFTRYFSFTRVSPNDGDLEMLVDVCFRIKAYLCYKFNKLDGRLEGFIVLHGPRAYVADLCRLFPNFLLQPLKPQAPGRLKGTGRGPGAPPIQLKVNCMKDSNRYD
jgi:hypothetical protein